MVAEVQDNDDVPSGENDVLPVDSPTGANDSAEPGAEEDAAVSEQSAAGDEPDNALGGEDRQTETLATDGPAAGDGPDLETAGEEAPEESSDDEVESMVKVLARPYLPEPESEPEPEPEAEAAPEPPPAMPVNELAPEPVSTAESSGGCGVLFGYLLSTIAGAFLGALLALLFLYLINGDLRFAATSQTTENQARVERALQTVEQNQAAIQSGAETLTAAVATMQADSAAAAAMAQEAQATVDALQLDVETMQADLAALAVEVQAMSATTAALEEQIETIAQSAERFDIFLTGLGEVLGALQAGAPITATATISGTPTPAATAGPDDLTPSATPRPTRTPRPTATPLVQPTATRP